ncbi:MAG: TerC/Alx family metal homeostasis membrane protein [Thermoleophilaceae bacterium]|nr:TerC/Alx family metal homeostasis membrane protein [Thermoleophilaceae bacterium]
MSDLIFSATGAWLALVVAIAGLLAIDLLLVRGRGGQMSVREAAVASAIWVGVSLGFFAVLLLAGRGDDASAYLAGYLVEKSLSLDNVFVFLLVFSAFGIATEHRHRLLTFGIVAALVLRAVFIVAGAALLAAFGWVSFLFAALLLWTAWRIFAHRHDHESEDRLVDSLRQRLRIADDRGLSGLTTREGGRRVLTTAGAALIAIGVVDLIFAIDSVPAILAITDDTYIVFAANAFALLGLRPLFFLVAELVERLYYLKTALAVLLAFIAVKMVLGELIGKIGPEVSLPVIALILGTGAAASLIRERRRGRIGVS